jgi:hypothetical protein
MLLGGTLLLAILGCKAKTPLNAGFPLPYPTPSSATDHALVCDFESNTPTAINPYLYDRNNPPAYMLSNPGWVTFWGYASVSITSSGPVSGGANGTQTAYACSGSVTDYGDGTYPSFTLYAQFKSDGTVYDMGAFTGVQYCLKVESDDTASWRAFQIPLPATMPVTSGGTCTRNCYDHFFVGYGDTGGVWKKSVYAFTDLKRQGYGDPLDPPQLTGSNLGQILYLQWNESNNNVPGIIRFDFQVDEIRLY